MPKIIFREANGAVHECEVAAGESVMQAALDAGLNGIRAECGGAAVCGTCQVKADPAWLARLAPPGDLEASLLDEEDLAARLRLSCQILMTPELDGLVVEIP